MHALIIEDESLIALTIEEALRDCGFSSFDVAPSAAAAVAAAARHCPDMITADVELSPGSGIDAVNAICSGPPVPVVFITGSPNEVTRGAPGQLMVVKPFTSEEVTAAVESALAGHGKGGNAIDDRL